MGGSYYDTTHVYGSGWYMPFVKRKPKAHRVWSMGRLFGYHLLPDPTPKQREESRQWIKDQIMRIFIAQFYRGGARMPRELCMTLEEYIDVEMTLEGHKSLFPGGKMLEDTDTRE